MNFLGQYTNENNISSGGSGSNLASDILYNGSNVEETLNTLLATNKRIITILNNHNDNILINSNTSNYTTSGNIIYLGSTVTTFNNSSIKIYRNGILLNKSTDVIYITSNTIRINDILYTGEIITIIN